MTDDSTTELPSPSLSLLFFLIVLQEIMFVSGLFWDGFFWTLRGAYKTGNADEASADSVR